MIHRPADDDMVIEMGPIASVVKPGIKIRILVRCTIGIRAKKIYFFIVFCTISCYNKLGVIYYKGC